MLHSTPTANAALDFQRLRKLIRQGASYAITLPAAWVHAHCNPKLPYIITSPQADGSIIVRPFNPNADLSRP